LVIPFAIKYTKINDECLNNKNKELILWYGDMLFFPHLIKVLSLKNIDVEVRIFTSLDASAIDDRKHLSNLSKKIIEESLNPEEANV
jgi:1-acyl-sn-glycerol-3-phosphate acyltransferase